MPLYEYECTACHKRTEKIQKFSDPEITACPKCGGGLERVLSAPAISFKGGGWYADGYGNAKPKNEGKSEGKTEGASESSKPDKSTPASGSSDSKASSDSSPSTPAPAPAAASATTPSSSPAATKS